MRRTKEEAEQTRHDLLAAALAVFSRKGFEATTLNEIATQAEVTRGAIYHHFGSKEDLYLALMDDASAQGNKAIQQAIETGGTFLQIVNRIIVNTLSLLEDDVRFRQTMALSLTHDIIPEMRQRRYQDAEQLIAGISEAFKMGITQGELYPDLNPATAARALIGYQNGLALLWLSNRDAFSIKAHAADLSKIFLHGIARPA